MKKLILLAFSFVSIAATAQQNAFTRMLKNYENSNFATVIDLGPEMMGMADGFLDDMGDLKAVMKDIKGMKIIVFDKKEENNFVKRKDSIYKNFTEALEKSDYKGMMNIKDGGNLVKMFTKPLKGGKSKDFVVAIQEEDEVVLIYLEGLLNGDDISKILNKK